MRVTQFRTLISSTYLGDVSRCWCPVRGQNDKVEKALELCRAWSESGIALSEEDISTALEACSTDRAKYWRHAFAILEVVHLAFINILFAP